VDIGSAETRHRLSWSNEKFVLSLQKGNSMSGIEGKNEGDL